MSIKYGDKNQYVSAMQMILKAKGYDVEADGIFGAKTEEAVKAFQRDQGLVVDGIWGKQTDAAAEGKQTKDMLTQNDIIEAAAILGVEPAVIHAVNRVEAKGRGYLPDGRIKILFERHIFYRELKTKYGQTIADKWAAEAPHICNRTPGGYRGGAAEYPRFSRANTIDPQCAMKSCSWGAYQIMGFNHAAAGFDDVDSFVEAVKTSEGEQLKAFVRFISADKAMHAALKAKKWADFARRYNGPDYRKNAYDTKLADVYQRFA